MKMMWLKLQSSDVNEWLSVYFRGYLLTLPSTVVRNTTARTCVTLHGIYNDVIMEFNLQLVGKDSVHRHKEIFTKGKY